jgi:hypothetical protein
MALKNRLRSALPVEYASDPASDGVRQRALERLYERRAAVEVLIESLEEYERCRERQRATCIEFTAAPTCS